MVKMTQNLNCFTIAIINIIFLIFLEAVSVFFKDVSNDALAGLKQNNRDFAKRIFENSARGFQNAD